MKSELLERSVEDRLSIDALYDIVSSEIKKQGLHLRQQTDPNPKNVGDVWYELSKSLTEVKIIYCEVVRNGDTRRRENKRIGSIGLASTGVYVQLLNRDHDYFMEDLEQRIKKNPKIGKRPTILFYQDKK